MTGPSVNTEHPVIIPFGDIELDGNLQVPAQASGLVLFAHGSGSSRYSIRNQFVARVLNEAKLATLLFDLLTAQEEAIDSQTFEYRFDIDFLAARLLGVTDWIIQQPVVANLPIGYFGASTGGSAAIVGAASRSNLIKAVVSRGGRPDLAGDALANVICPVLLIVGGNDEPVIELNKAALKKLPHEKHLEIIPGATHLFEEPGALNQVANLARKWFTTHLK